MVKKIEYFVFLVASVFLCLAACYQFYRNSNYFLTRKRARAEILSINVKKNERSYIQLAYYNEFINRRIEYDVDVKENKYEISNKFKENDSIDIFYAKNYPYKIYIDGMGALRWPIVLFDLIMMIIMLLGIFLCTMEIKRKQLKK